MFEHFEFEFESNFEMLFESSFQKLPATTWWDKLREHKFGHFAQNLMLICNFGIATAKRSCILVRGEAASSSSDRVIPYYIAQKPLTAHRKGKRPCV